MFLSNRVMVAPRHHRYHFLMGIKAIMPVCPFPAEEKDMKTWRKPKTAEIRVGTEINAYACAGL